MTPSDAELVKDALAGSQAACAALVERYAASAVNLAARLVNDRALAEDLAQEEFIKAFRQLARYDSQRRFAPWFLQIVRNVTIDHLRRHRINTVSLDQLVDAGYSGPTSTAADASPDRQAAQAQLSRALDLALQRIRPAYREAVVLRYQEGLTNEEIAAVLSVPLGTVKTYLHRARKAMAALMTETGWDPSASAAKPQSRETRREE